MLTLHCSALLKPIEQPITVISPIDIVFAERFWQPLAAAHQIQDHLVGPWGEGELDGHSRQQIGCRESGVGLQLQQAERLQIAKHEPLVFITPERDQCRPRTRCLAQSGHGLEVVDIILDHEPGAPPHGETHWCGRASLPHAELDLVLTEKSQLQGRWRHV